jgi:ABC-type lipoprotein export system ATPase subunit
MIKLKDVSKYYYNKGIISSGFSKINLELNIGEFVVITGQSGSGKSTLLNVISGLDTYEEGEMYINGEETSHYSESDFENYRKKYISNIFQNFNLVNSYTVYQNIELVCLINGYKRSEVKDNVLELIKLVDLTKYKNTKISKLSGGQKQRVAIARALAKNTPVIIADEPTGNLDKKSALNVMKTLHDVSKDKLVIIVTHNFEQVEQYATRKITMFDGKIIEDKKYVKENIESKTLSNEFKPIKKLSEVKLSLRNTFNIIPKFLLLLFVFLFMILAITCEQASFASSKYEESKYGYNEFLNNTSSTRIIINKTNKEAFTDEDYQLIQNLDNVDYIIKNDLEVDSIIYLSNENSFLRGYPLDKSELSGSLDYGKMPESENEFIIEINSDSYYCSRDINSMINNEYIAYTNYDYDEDSKLTLVGIKINDDLDYSTVNIYLTSNVKDEINKKLLLSNSTIKININNNTLTSGIKALSSVPEGYVYLDSSYNYLCTYSTCQNKKINISIKNLYLENDIDLKVSKTLTKDNYKKLTGLTYDEYSTYIFLNPNDYDKLITTNIYQSSVFVKNDKNIKETANLLNSNNYNTYIVNETLRNDGETTLYILNIINVIITIILLFVMFFISYFIIKLILKSRHTYFTTLRILGSSSKSLKRILMYELYTVLNIAELIIISLILLIKNDVIKLVSVKNLLSFITLKDYALIYLILIIMTYFISLKFASYIFKKSAMKTFNEEV